MTLFTECNCECILISCCLCFLMSCNSCYSCVGSGCNHSELLARSPMSQGRSPTRCSAGCSGSPRHCPACFTGAVSGSVLGGHCYSGGSISTVENPFSFYTTQRAAGSGKKTFCFISSEYSCFSHVAESHGILLNKGQKNNFYNN